MQADRKNSILTLVLSLLFYVFAAAPTGRTAGHEFAHALGLGHSNDKNEQMFPYADEDVFFGKEDIHPSACEAKGLALIYPMRPYCIMPEKVDCF